jgi:hypothetical protein
MINRRTKINLAEFDYCGKRIKIREWLRVKAFWREAAWLSWFAAVLVAAGCLAIIIYSFTI